MHRRSVLASVAVVTGSLAGCLQSADADPENGTNDDGSSAGTGPTLGDSSVETTGTDCASGNAGEVEVEPGDDQLTVVGTIQASTPCHDAVLESVSLEEQTLAVTVDVEETDQVCVECVGEVAYEVTVEIDDPDGLEEAHVEHVDRGTHSFSWASASEGAAEPPSDDAA